MRMSRRMGLFQSLPLSIRYTGEYNASQVTMDGTSYILLELMGSGVLTATKTIKGDIWFCGGGGCGTLCGGGGAYCDQLNNISFNQAVITIGAGSTTYIEDGDNGGGNTTLTINSTSYTAYGGNRDSDGDYRNEYGTGGSGGGGCGSKPNTCSWGRGDGEPKLPFNSSYFPYPYCDGGGGGSYYDANGTVNYSSGGDGGTNGSDGNKVTTVSAGNVYVNTSTNTCLPEGGSGNHYGGAGGAKVAGEPYSIGWGTVTPMVTKQGKNASGYGSGGGGGYYYEDDDGDSEDGSVGAGYQGICFIRFRTIPYLISRLPSGYTELSYIEANGNQYVDTGVIPSNNTKVECDFQLTETGSSNTVIFGVAGQFSFRKYNASTFRTNGSNTASFSNITPDTNKHSVTKTPTSTTLTTTDTSETKTTTAGSCSLTLSIFAYHSASTTYANNSSVKIYKFKIYNSDSLIRDMVPAKNSSNVAGLYDVVNDVFYTSGTNTALIAGSVVN